MDSKVTKLDWRKLFLGTEEQSLSFFPPEFLDGSATVKAPLSVIEEGIAEWNTKIVGQFIGVAPNFASMQRIIGSLWGKFSPVKNIPLVLRKWEPSMQKLDFDLTNMPVERLEYAKVCIKISAGFEIPDEIQVVLKDGTITRKAPERKEVQIWRRNDDAHSELHLEKSFLSTDFSGAVNPVAGVGNLSSELQVGPVEELYVLALQDISDSHAKDSVVTSTELNVSTASGVDLKISNTYGGVMLVLNKEADVSQEVAEFDSKLCPDLVEEVALQALQEDVSPINDFPNLQDFVANKKKRTLITAVYASNSGLVRRELWNHLKNLECMVGSASWVVEGDFNVILRAEESSDCENLGLYSSSEMDDIQDCLQDLDLMDHPYQVPTFTWTNRQDVGVLARKLDRIWINPQWLINFSDSYVEYMAQGVSDHCLGLLAGGVCWQSYAIVLSKREDYERIQLHNLNHTDQRSLKEEKRIYVELVDLEVDESEFYKQKAKVYCLKESDLNTNFFHQRVESNKKRNTIKVLMNASGQYMDSFEDMVAELVNFFTNLIDDAGDVLFRDVDDKEIKATLFRQGNGTSQWPDGYSSWFFKAAWEVVGCDFLVAISQYAFVKGRNIADNTLLAQEIVKGYSRKSLSPGCAIKIDLQKAFDYVNWVFFMVVLEAMGLPDKFCGWIKTCVTSPKYSILFNGSLNGIFKYHPKCKRISLTHLCFADDLLVFCHGSLDVVLGVLSTLEVFYELSGLRLNAMKTEIYACGVSDHVLEQIHSGTGFKVGKLPVRYLGVLLVTRKLAWKECSALVIKIKEKLSKWSSKKLSFGGRLQLIKAVMFSIFSYWSRQLIMPNGVIRDIEKLCMRFFWKGGDTPTRGARVRWRQICSLKSEGGLGSVDFWNVENKIHFSWILAKLLKLKSDAWRLFCSNCGWTQSKVSWIWDNIRSRLENVNWHRLVWFPGHVPKFSLIFWMAILDRLPTKYRLASIWRAILLTCDLAQEFICWSDHLQWLIHNLKGKSLLVHLLKLAWTGFIYYIWEERNHMIFRGVARSIDTIVSRVKDAMRIKLYRSHMNRLDAVNIYRKFIPVISEGFFNEKKMKEFSNINSFFCNCSWLSSSPLPPSFTLATIIHLCLRYFYLPRLISEVLAGVILGPTVLGRLVLQHVVKVLSTLTRFGYLFFMLLIGVTMDVNLLRKSGRREWTIGSIVIIFPILFIVSSAQTISLKVDKVKEDAQQWVSLFAGLFMLTSFPVVAILLMHLKIINSELGNLTLSSALITDQDDILDHPTNTEGKPVKDAYLFFVIIALLVAAVAGENAGLQYMYGSDRIWGNSKGDSLLGYFFTVTFGVLFKMACGFIPAICLKVPLKDVIAMAPMLTSKGIIELGCFAMNVDKTDIDPQEFSWSVSVYVALVPIVTRKLYDPSKTYRGYQKLDFAHRKDDALSATKLLQLMNPFKGTPLSVFGLYLEELVGGSSPLLLNHQLGRKSCYEGGHWQPSIDEMEQKGKIIADSKELRAFNIKVMNKAPCSVGILVDRDQSRRIPMADKSSKYHVCVLYLGGKDDREALAIGRMMKGWPLVNLTVLPCKEDEDEDAARQGWEAMLDDDCVGFGLKLSWQVENFILVGGQLIGNFILDSGQTLNMGISYLVANLYTLENSLIGEVLDTLFQQGLDIAIEEEKPEYMEEKEWGTINHEFEHLETTLLHGNDNVTLKDVTVALYSYELRKKTKKESKYEATEAMVARDCPKLKKKGKAAPDACVAEHDANDSDISLVASSTTFHSDEWILDSGCTYHMSPNREWFSDLVELNAGVVYMGNDNACKTVGIGSIRLKNQDGSTRVLTDVRYVPSLKKNLISLGALESKGSVVTMRVGVLKVTYVALVMMKGIRENNLYYYQGSTIIGAVAAAFGGDDLDTTQLWHMQLGHAGEKSLQILVKKELLKGAKACKLNFCEHCVLGKQKRVKFGTTIHNTKCIVDYIHSDVWGHSNTSSLGGNHYFVTFVDDFSRRVWVYSMKSKDEVLRIFLKWKNMIENQTGRKIKCLRTDNRGEYKSTPFFDVCHEYGIVRHFTVRNTPQQNGVAERMHRTLLEKVRCMLSNTGLGKAFWTEAVTYAGHLINRLPSSAIGGKTPLEVWSGKPATDYDSLHVFGSTSYYHVKESKLDPRAKKAFFMGITHGVKGFRLWCLDTKKIICSRDVTFDKSSLIKKVTNEAVQTSSTPQQVEHTPKQVQTQEPLETPEPLTVTRPRREICRPARFVDMVAYALPVVDDDIPITYQEAIQSLESKRAIGCKWVFAKKDGSHSKKDVRYKAQLVAKGYSQKEGIDYNEVFSPVVRHSSIRILLTLVAQLNLELAQLDVKTAFLHGDLEEEIYMTQPEGYKDGGCEKWVCKLNKSLYGLKQSPRQWYKRFDSFIRRKKYTRSKYDHCVNLQKLKDGYFIYLLLYVDDMLIASKSKKEIDKLKAQLNQEFEMKDLGEAKKILGMEICRDRQRWKLCLTQKQYLRKVLQCFGMNENTKHVSIPLASHLKLSSQLSPKTNEEREYMKKVPYANAVGSLMHAMVCTRPYISQAVEVVSRYMHDPGEGHWQAVKWILRYFQQIVDVGLVFEQDETLGQCVVGYVDSDYAGDFDQRRSTTEYLFTLAKAPVSWKSTLQSTMALSTTKFDRFIRCATFGGFDLDILVGRHSNSSSLLVKGLSAWVDLQELGAIGDMLASSEISKTVSVFVVQQQVIGK
ncbi:hypothetical protein F3Y22_tig00110332pilonHSYRG00622 [Hibiscus syriacus]|uniref:Integrase catalytic domain-containing protein n=1 Tax=Hibiscus syriacus TaxID=106335 RepID=A0A6A3AX11_HIBSY|nr:hypothetical protein F3Y22_tig00110332pilonHSYRG00622 [Hibiscus syriacus]